MSHESHDRDGVLRSGQVGVAEGSCAMIFGLYGLPAAAGMTLSLARRVRTVIIAAIGMLTLNGPAPRLTPGRQR